MTPALSPEEAVTAAVLIGRLRRALAHDADVLASVVRAMETTRPDAERFRQLVRAAVKEVA
jgi:hypothetical protein